MSTFALLDIEAADVKKEAEIRDFFLAPPHCWECRFWNNSSALADKPDESGRCTLKAPIADDRTSQARWPYTDQHDSCFEGRYASPTKLAGARADAETRAKAHSAAPDDDEVPF